jgi:hypothetical protein
MILHRLEVHSIDHCGSTRFRYLDLLGKVFQGALARSEEAYSGECGRNRYHEGYRIRLDQPQESGSEQQDARHSRQPCHDHAFPTLLCRIGQGVYLSFEVGNLLVRIGHPRIPSSIDRLLKGSTGASCTISDTVSVKEASQKDNDDGPDCCGGDAVRKWAPDTQINAEALQQKTAYERPCEASDYVLKKS